MQPHAWRLYQPFRTRSHSSFEGLTGCADQRSRKVELAVLQTAGPKLGDVSQCCGGREYAHVFGMVSDQRRFYGLTPTARLTYGLLPYGCTLTDAGLEEAGGAPVQAHCGAGRRELEAEPGCVGLAGHVLDGVG